MDKLQWFKFTPTDWVMGKIQRCPEITQARFMRIICIYWNKECVLSYEDAEIEIDKEHLDILISKKIIKIDEMFLVIDFLNEQFDVINNKRDKNQENGLKGGRPPKNQEVGTSVFYVVRLYDNDESFTKAGITSSSTKRRMNNIPYSYEILFEKIMDTHQALEMESLIYSNCEQYTPLKDFGGKLECYRNSLDVINLCITQNNPTQTEDKPTINQIKPEKSREEEEEEKSKKELEKTIEFRKSQFVESLQKFKSKYPADMMNEFYRYWVSRSEKNETLMLFEVEEIFLLGGRLATWFKKSEKKDPVNSEIKKQVIESWSKKFNLSFTTSKAKDNGIRAVIVSIEGNIKARAPELTQNEVNDGVVNMWNAILQKWDTLEPFLAKQISFDRIASNFDNILIQLNGTGIATKQKTGIDTTQFRRPQY